MNNPNIIIDIVKEQQNVKNHMRIFDNIVVLITINIVISSIVAIISLANYFNN